MVDRLDIEFSKHFYNGDSIALYNMYAKNAYLVTVKEKGILASGNKQI